MARFGWLSDSHVGFQQYGLDRRRKDFEYALEAAVERMLYLGIRKILHSGDLLHSNRPSSEAIACLKRVHKKLIQYGATMYVVPGNHDDTTPPWPEILEQPGLDYAGTGIVMLDGKMTEYQGVKIYGLPNMSPEAFKSAILPEADVLVCHLMIQEFVKYPSPAAIPLEQMPLEKYQAILVGDVHITSTSVVKNCFIGYPGSTELNSKSESEHKFWIELNIEPGLPVKATEHKIPTRMVLRADIENEDQVPTFINYALKAFEQHKAETGDTRAPIVFFKHPVDLPGVVERFRTAFNPDEWILRPEGVLVLKAPTGMPIPNDEKELTVQDILRSQLAMRHDLLPVASQLIQPDVNADAAITAYIENRIQQIEGTPAPPNGGAPAL